MFRQNLCGTALGEHTVTDLTPARKKAHTGFTNAERREVVMEHELLEIHPLDIVHTLLVSPGTQRGGNQCLCFTAGKQSTTVGARQHADFTADRADSGHVATVNPDPVFGDHQANNSLFHRTESCGDFPFTPFVDFSQMFLNFSTDITQCRITILLALDLDCLDDLWLSQFGDSGHKVFISLSDFKYTLFLTDQFGQFFLNSNQRLKCFVAEKDGIQHVRFREEIRLTLNHHHGILGTRNNDLDITLFDLFVGRVSDKLTVNATDANSGNRTFKWNVGNRDRSRGGNHRQSVRVIDQVSGYHRRHNLGFEHVALREERPHRTVDQATDQGLTLGGTTLPTEERTRNFTC